MAYVTYCRARECRTPALTEFTDGDGLRLWLCERHGDELGRGGRAFPLTSRPIPGPLEEVR